MIRTWCKDHPIQFMACYLVFYLAFFKLLEQGIQVPDLVLHCRCGWCSLEHPGEENESGSIADR